VFSYALTQSPLVTYIVFTSIGLGMASPYLLLGAFPSLVRFLPKPGAWMETFKQLMGFILLGTVVYLVSLLDKNLFVPVLALLVGLSAGCWWIGRTPLTANLGRKLAAWLAGAAAAAAIGWFALTALVPHAALLPWEPYSTAKLGQLLADRKTVMIDFTANWCPSCQFNSARAINRQGVAKVVRANGVVPLLADWSDKSPEIERMLDALNHSASIPLLAVFPAGRPNEPIVLRDLISQSEVVETLQEAGPSQTGLASVAQPAR
jgi:thiol:disulfide interchange protein